LTSLFVSMEFFVFVISSLLFLYTGFYSDNLVKAFPAVFYYTQKE